MAKGAESKAKVFEKLETIFPDAFWNGPKEFRIPMEENGERVELKVALTCAKENVGSSNVAETPAVETETVENKPEANEPTEEEINNIKNLAKVLGF